MKKSKFFGFTLLICVLLLCLASTIDFDITDSNTIASTESLASFLEFEQAVVAMNKNNLANPKIEHGDVLIDEGNKFSIENAVDEFYLQRLIVQGNIDDTYGASDVVSYNNLHILCYSL